MGIASTRRMEHPHILLAVLRHDKWCFITMDMVGFHNLCFHQIMNRLQIILTETDHPSCHILPRNVDIISKEFFRKTVQRYRIYILCIKHGSCQFRGKNTMCQQTFRCFCTQKTAAIRIPGIYFDMMFQYFKSGWNILKFFIYFIFHRMPSFWKMFP